MRCAGRSRWARTTRCTFSTTLSRGRTHSEPPRPSRRRSTELEADLVICATESTDAYSGIVPGALAELLELPQLTFAREATVDGETITVKRAVDTGVQTIQATLPVMLTVTASIAEPRYPTFRGLMQAKRKPIEVKTVADLGLDPSSVGEAGAQEQVTDVATQTIEKEGIKIHDDGGDSVEQLVDYLKRIEVI